MTALAEIVRRGAWAPALVFVAHMILWHGVGAYEAFPPLDTPMHLLGGVAIAFFFWTAYSICARTGAFGQPNSTAIAVLTLTSAVASAVFWEFAEYLSDRYLGTNTQKGLEDTLLDMLLGIVGGAVFVGVAWFRRRRSDLRPPDQGG
ncbi:MAG: hypothetical protein OQK55_04595 [Thermoanaerobaculales bacterium]|nr:hypothetical protein [Thermoanaerobaculales bacterium]